MNSRKVLSCIPMASLGWQQWSMYDSSIKSLHFQYRSLIIYHHESIVHPMNSIFLASEHVICLRISSSSQYDFMSQIIYENCITNWGNWDIILLRDKNNLLFSGENLAIIDPFFVWSCKVTRIWYQKVYIFHTAVWRRNSFWFKDIPSSTRVNISLLSVPKFIQRLVMDWFPFV